MVKILLDFTKLPQSEFKTFLEYVFKKMNENPTYSMFNVLIAALGAMIPAYSDALFTAKDGGDTDPKNKLRADANFFMKKFALKIQVQANDLPTIEAALAFAKGTGFSVATEITKLKTVFLEVPTGFFVSDKKLQKGACYLEWLRVTKAITYLIEELDKDGNWQTVGVSKLPKFLYLGTESEVLKTFRIRAIGANNLMSDFTEGVSVWVR